MSNVQEAGPDLGVLLNLAFGGFKDRLHKYMAASGFDDLGSSFGYVFRALDAEPLSLAQLSERLAITPQGGLKIVNEMEARGYVVRRPDRGDRRIKHLVLTARGRAALRAARRFHKKVERDLTKEFGMTMVRSTRSILGALTGSAESREHPRPF